MSKKANATGSRASTHRGKLVSADPDFAKKEFQKRRRIRLEQVRQQSKDIAEDVRNKVRKEKTNQLSSLERRGEQELRKWQDRKLVALQQQYQECLKDIGLGHMQATIEEESDEAVETQKEGHDYLAQERGERAIKGLQKQKEQEQIFKSTPLLRKKHVQNVEKTRSAHVVHLNKKKINSTFKKKKRKGALGDTGSPSRLCKGSASESGMPELLELYSSNSSSKSNSPKIKSTEQYSSPQEFQYVRGDYNRLSENADDEKFTMQYVSPLPRQEHGPQVFMTYPVDNRISDRIKRRTLKSAFNEPVQNICDNVIRDGDTNKTQCEGSIKSPNKKHYETEVLNKKPISNSEQPMYDPIKNVDAQIPTKPTVSLRTAPASTSPTKFSKRVMSANSKANRVQYYDHKNRYFKEYVPNNANVEKIDVDSLEVRACTDSETEFVERMYKRDREAELRGKKALEKLKVRRDYEELMHQLPVLQKQERIASIPAHKTTYHMSENRLKELQQKRQNRMENVYESLFPKRQVITIPSKMQSQSTSSDLPFQAFNIRSTSPVLDVGSWDFDAKEKAIPNVLLKNIDSNLVKEAVKKVGEMPADADVLSQRRENLQDMLQSITSQREKLAKELSSLPMDSHLHQLFDQFGNIDALINVSEIATKKSSTSKPQQRSRIRQRTDRASESQNVKASSSSLSPSYRISKSPNNFAPFQVRERTGSKYHTSCASYHSSQSPLTKTPGTSVPKRRSNVSKGHRKRKPQTFVQTAATQTTPATDGTKKTSKVSTQTVEDAQQPQSVAIQNQHHSDEDGDRRTEKSVQDREVRISEPLVVQTVSTKSQASGGESTKLCTCCGCAEHGKRACEIVIKISEEGQPEICLSPIELTDNKITVTTADVKKVDDREAVSRPKSSLKKANVEMSKEKQKVKLDKPKFEDKPKTKAVSKVGKLKKHTSFQKSGLSWREQFSQNSSNSSTSYYSPPTRERAQEQPVVEKQKVTSHYSSPTPARAQEQPVVSKQKVKTDLVNILLDKPRQGNLPDAHFCSDPGDASRTLNSYLYQHIKRLLMMSRGSINELGVSSGSDMSTPSSSVVNVHPNLSSSELMKHFNSNLSDIERYLSCSPDGSHIHYNTSESTSSFKSETNYAQIQPRDARQMTVEEYTAENYPGVLVAYNKLAENCAKKIENLAAMIEKVRLDKLSMLQSHMSLSDKENSTEYLELPTEFKEQKSSDEHKSSLSDAEQEELVRKLLEIDYSFAEQLKKMTAADIAKKHPLSVSGSSNTSTTNTNVAEEEQDPINVELMQRFKNLLESHKAPVKAADSPKLFVVTELCNVETEGNKVAQEQNIPFVPFLDDIPRLPKFEEVADNRKPFKSKPPPSKGLSVARRFNSEINTVPHELSTIVETDSSRPHRPKTPESQESTGITEEKVAPVIITDPIVAADSVIAKPKTSSSDSLPDILVELTDTANNQVDNKQQKQAASRSKQGQQRTTLELVSDSPASEHMESVLIGMGMGWAVATLRKTQEALALSSSSSSSLDISVKQKEIKLTDSGSVSLKLLSSSTTTGDSSAFSPFSNEFQNISAIRGSSMSQEKATVRTSTPIQSSKSTDDKLKNDSQPSTTITGESEVLSLEKYSHVSVDGVPFYSLKEQSSIDTSKSTIEFQNISGIREKATLQTSTPMQSSKSTDDKSKNNS